MQISLSIDKGLVEHSLTHSFMLSMAAFLPQGQSWKSCNRNCMACKAKNHYCLAPYRKSLQTPALGNLTFHAFTLLKSLLRSHLIREVLINKHLKNTHIFLSLLCFIFHLSLHHTSINYIIICLLRK